MSEIVPPGQGFESIGQPLTPEEACLLALLDLESVQEEGRLRRGVRAFYEAYTGEQAPESLRTAITTSAGADRDPGQYSPSYADVAATVVVRFKGEGQVVEVMHNFDFVRASGDMRVFERRRDPDKVGAGASEYTRLLDRLEVNALQQDALTIKQLIAETGT